MTYTSRDTTMRSAYERPSTYFSLLITFFLFHCRLFGDLNVKQDVTCAPHKAHYMYASIMRREFSKSKRFLFSRVSYDEFCEQHAVYANY